MPSRNPNQRRGRRSPQDAKSGRGRKARSLAVAVRREVWRSPPGARGKRVTIRTPGKRLTTRTPGKRATTRTPGKRVTTRRWAGGHRVNLDSVAGGPKRRVELFGQLGKKRAS